MADPGEEHQVTAHTDINAEGGYSLVVGFDDDNVLHLDGLDVLRYVAALADAMVRAQYAEAMRAQLRARLKLSDRDAAVAAGKWRDDLPALATFDRYEIRPCVSVEGRTSVQVWRGGQVVVQFAESNVQEHIYHVLIVHASADRDVSYHRLLTGHLRKGDGVARDCIRTLTQYLKKD